MCQDVRGELFFTSNTSELTQRVMHRTGYKKDATRSVLVFDGDRLHERSDAIIFLSGYFRGPFRALRFARILPRFVRNLCYSVVALLRYRLFGTVQHCVLLSPEQRGKVIE
jgi:predicted DCC family thiol-disulfide oxidoreductase YuxK